MKLERRHLLSVVASLVMVGLLVYLTVVQQPSPANILPGILFGILILLTMIFGVLLVEGEVSLLPMTTVASYLVIGPVLAGWAAFLAAIGNGLVRYFGAGWLGQVQRPEPVGLIGLTAANATMHTASILVGGLVFGLLGGSTPLVQVAPGQIVALVGFGLAYLAANYLLAGVYIAERGWASLQLYVRSLPRLILLEGAPLLFAPLMALVYNGLGLWQFLLFALILPIVSLITRNLALTGRRLERRVKELSSLQAVGQVLSASLDVETVLAAIYDQVSRLMPARNFYVALYAAETEEVSFPLAIEHGERVQWRSRRAGNGLTEYVLRSGEPLLLQADVQAAIDELGLTHIGLPAACWLGVPLLAGAEPLGIIAVQSYTLPEAYDASHQEVLVTIAAQAAVAIQNARLYARTDDALARRVQEMTSILRTTQEGILLLDADWRIVTANRALADLVGMAQGELVGQDMTAPLLEGEVSIAALLGDSATELAADCEALARGEGVICEKKITTPDPPERHLKRTLTPVRERDGSTSGWLLALQDITEEIQLARLKDEMTRMLVHDLRSPLTVMKGSLDMMTLVGADGDWAAFERLLEMAQRNNAQMLRMVNDLLDISKLEAGQQPVAAEETAIGEVFQEVAARFGPLLASTDISLEIEVAPDVPLLYIDPYLVGRVLGNLVDNAIKFTPDGGQIRLWARRDDRRGAMPVVIGVSDTGRGIPAEDHHLLFQKFQRIGDAPGRWAGTGLGLSFCKLAVETHGGRIWVESQVGQGTTFFLTLPVVDSASLPG